MERSPRKSKDKETDQVFDFVFRNAFGSPIIFTAAPTNAQMKANTWGKVKDVNTAIYIKFADAGAIKITGTELS